MASWFTPVEVEALRLSLKVATVAVAASLPLGIALGLLLSRRRFVGHGLVNGLIHLPLILPPVVTGYLLLLGFGRNGPLGRLLEPLGISFAFNWKGAALAAGVMAFPLMVRAIRLAADSVDPGLEQAAASLGAPRAWVWLTVTLPLMLPGIVAGSVLAFAKALGEFGATMTFVANIPGQTRTLPLAIHAALQQPGGEAPAMRLALLSVLLAAGALALSEWLARRIARRQGAPT